MKRIYIEKSKVNEMLTEISSMQRQKNLYVNVAVKPYRGKKYDPKNTAVIVIG